MVYRIDIFYSFSVIKIVYLFLFLVIFDQSLYYYNYIIQFNT